MRNIMKKLSLLILVALLSACTTGDNFQSSGIGLRLGDPDMPFRPGSMPPLPRGSAEFTQGWRDGCQSGMSVYGDSTYKSIYKWVQDQDLIDNEKYYKAWKDSYNYCRHFLQIWSADFTNPNVAMVPTDTRHADPLFEGQNGAGNFLVPTTDTGFANDYSGDFFSFPTTDSFFGY